MIEFNGKKLCENCFSEWTVGTFCTRCGYNPAVTATDPTMLKPGSVLLGKYIVGKVIGKGGFGVTYVAYDVTTNKKVAIKEFFPYGVALRAPGTSTVSVSSMDNADAFKMGAEKFYNEAKLVSKFNGNPNIVGVHEFFYENDTVYFAMEFLQGHTLKEHIQEHGVLTPAQALFIFQNVSNALMVAHSLNVMHRDISPDNIILCDNGDVKLIDFGAARQVVAEHSQSFSVILKPGFAPLEQYQKKGNQGPWTDIYSLGATIYHSLTEDIPEDPMSRIDDDEEFSSNKYNIEPELWAIIKKATQLKIEDRYGDIFMLRNDLNNVSYQPEPVIVPKENPSDKMPEIHTAVPFGMTQAVTQPVQQPVTVAAVNPVPGVQPVQQPMNAGAPNPPAVSDPANTPAPAKKSSKKILGIFGGIAAAAAIALCAIFIPKALKASDNPPISTSKSPTARPESTQSSTSSISSTNSISSTSSTSSTPPKSEPTPSYLSDKIFYNSLNQNNKAIYKLLYDAIDSKTEILDLSSYNYKYGDVNDIFGLIMHENAKFNYTNGFSSEYTDANGNGKRDNDDIITGLTIGYIADYGKVENVIKQFSDEHSGETVYEKLRAFHDKLIREVEIITKGNSNGKTAYGALVEKKSYQRGVARAFCLYAQELGLPCVVAKANLGIDTRYLCRVKIDGVWYNVDVYGDKTAGDYVKKLNVNPESTACYHTYFLCNDDYLINGCGYFLEDQYKFLLNGEYAANSKYANYYIQDGMNGHDYAFKYTVDSAYDWILNWAAERYNDGKYDSSIHVASFIFDDVFLKTKNNLKNDLKSKHGITVSGFSTKYNINTSEYIITLEP